MCVEVGTDVFEPKAEESPSKRPETNPSIVQKSPSRVFL
jgi:hypothetical protein